MKRDLINFLFVAIVLAGCTSVPAAVPKDKPVKTDSQPWIQPSIEPTSTFAIQPTVEQVTPVETKLSGRKWKWQQTLMSDDTVHKPDDPTRYTIEFQNNGELDALADCNRVTGEYQLDGFNMKITLGVTTLMACPAGSLDSVFKKDLNEVNNFFFNDGSLFLGLKYDSGVIEFKP